MKIINTYILNLVFYFRFFRNIYSMYHGKKKFFEQEKKELAELDFFENLNFLFGVLSERNKREPFHEARYWQREDGDNSRLTYSYTFIDLIRFGLFSNSDDAGASLKSRFAIEVKLSGTIKPLTHSYNLYFLKDNTKHLMDKSNNVLQFNIKIKDHDKWNFDSDMVEIIHLDNSNLIWREEILKLALEERSYQKRKNDYSENEYNSDNVLSIDNANDKEKLIRIADILKTHNFIGIFYFFFRNPPSTPLTKRKLFRDFYHQFDDDEFKFHSYSRSASKYCFHQNELKFRYRDDFYKIYFNDHIYGKKEIYDPHNTKNNVIRYIIERNGHLIFSFLSEHDFEKMYPDIKNYDELIICDKPKEIFQPFSSDRMSIGVLEKYYDDPSNFWHDELVLIKDTLRDIAHGKDMDTEEMVIFSDSEVEMYQHSVNFFSEITSHFAAGGSFQALSTAFKITDNKDK